MAAGRGAGDGAARPLSFRPGPGPAGAAALLPQPVLAETELPCQSVRLDQLLPGLLTIRFVPALRRAAQPATQLAFTGVLAASSPPLGCRDGTCDPRGDLELRVSAVAISGLDPQGLPVSLPQALLARGSCSVAARLVICQAWVAAQRHWRAEAYW
ncbi:MAG: hypothetical protein VKJ44_06305 [Synechococcus sp.]|nr:hypothetical protein [Synechococcus sp.]